MPMTFGRTLRTALLLGGLVACSSSQDESTAKQGTAKVAPTPVEMTSEPWTATQLLAPAELAAQLTGVGPKPVVFDMGPAGTIKGARRIGPAQDEANLTKLRAELVRLPKDQVVVVYCGCCPFEPCPNIRPAFRALQAAGLTNIRLLNLAQNLKADWIDKGYPLEP